MKEVSIHHEGDERSRTNPGHGYPAHTEYTVQVTERFYEEEPFKQMLKHELQTNGSPETVRGFKIIPYKSQTVIEVSQVQPTAPAWR
jgi:hypothetical protein